MSNYKIYIDSLLTIDDSGMPCAPNIRQLLDKDIKELYRRDRTDDKSIYIKECIVIYYLGDPKSPAFQAGLSKPEALKMAIEIADLPKTYIPDALVLRLIDRYYEENIGEAGRVVENILQGLHNINVVINKINLLLNEKINGSVSLEDISSLYDIQNKIITQSKELPATIKRLQEAKENLMYEKETEMARGGVNITSSMDAENYKN